MSVTKSEIFKSLNEELDLIIELGNIAVQKAKAENHRLGIPNVFGKDGILYYELPNGTITTERPETLKEKNPNPNFPA